MSDYIMLFDRDGQPYIAHHGILGQKWGVRRYQNKDGTRTNSGKIRYSAKVERARKELDDFKNDFKNNNRLIEKHLEYAIYWDGVPLEDVVHPGNSQRFDFDKDLPKMLNNKQCIEAAYENYTKGRYHMNDEDARKAHEKYKELKKNYDDAYDEAYEARYNKKDKSNTKSKKNSFVKLMKL